MRRAARLRRHAIVAQARSDALARGTHGVLTGVITGVLTWGYSEYSQGTHGVLTGYSQGYSRGTHGVLTGYSRGTHAQAMKWWPGNLGKTATHCLVYANLILHGEERGFHVFLCAVPARHTHNLTRTPAHTHTHTHTHTYTQ